ncbi:C39 family peptidase [Streptomyces sp. SP17KL33]|uniref:C39 family peptidase n=1 Tax=Streptomyces sp. SP17KL33 TaxID=3002534 RepID=UPI002E759B45|nr:C39 family peptidase [Streptomyces sp. SP17KL33]
MPLPRPCCADDDQNGRPPVHTPVPVVTQYASAHLITRIAYHGHDPADDPNWSLSGAPSRAVYARWCRHICGMACLRMALLHRFDDAPSLFTLLSGALHYGAYVEQNDEINGLIYAPFARYVEDTHQVGAAVHGTFDLAELIALLDDGHMVMTSVSKEIRRPGRAPERRGGHLVLAIGHDNGRIIYRNPSGHTPEARQASLPADRFDDFFAHRGISLDLRRTEHSLPSPATATGPVASPSST